MRTTCPLPPHPRPLPPAPLQGLLGMDPGTTVLNNTAVVAGGGLYLTQVGLGGGGGGGHHCRVQGTGLWAQAQGAGCRALGTGYRAEGCGHRVQGSGQRALGTAYVVFSVSNSSRSFPFYSRGKSETSSSATSLTTARNAQQTMVISYELIGKRNQNTTEFVEPLFLERKTKKQKK